MKKIELVPIGIIRSCYTEKFAIPRQPGLVKSAVAELELYSPWNRQTLFAGIEKFSHIWVQFYFSEAAVKGWRDSVRPPGLGGRKRVGVFASRSPHRPNHIGISVVKLLSVEKRKSGTVLIVSGGDFMDGTPLLDIKPYLVYSDSVAEATSSYAGNFFEADVVFDDCASSFCRKYQQESGRNLFVLIQEVLSQDPRPASQKGRRKEFGMTLWDVNIRFRVESSENESITSFIVTECTFK